MGQTPGQHHQHDHDVAADESKAGGKGSSPVSEGLYNRNGQVKRDQH